MQNKKTVLITGGAGFIGSHIADKYILNGYNVVVIDNLSSGDIRNLNSAVKFYKLDIYKQDLTKVFIQNKIDAINHHAAQIDVRVSQSNPVLDQRINIEGSLKLMNYAVKHNIPKIIFASSGGAVYGEQIKFPANETHPTNPLSPYGISKLSFEKYLEFYKLYYGINYVCLRYSNVYGPRQNLKGEAGVVSVFCNKILKNEQPVVNGNGKQTRDYVFVADVAKANLIALRYNKSGTFNIATSKETSVNELYGLINNNYGNKFKRINGVPVKGEQKRSVLDFSKAKKQLKW